MKKLSIFLLLVLFLAFPGACLAQETRLKVIKLHYASADSTAEMSKKFLSAAGKISSDPRTNSIIIVDRPETIEKIELIIKHIDVKGSF